MFYYFPLLCTQYFPSSLTEHDYALKRLSSIGCLSTITSAFDCVLCLI